MEDNEPSAIPGSQPLLVEVVDGDGARHWTAFDSELVKKYGLAPEDPKAVPSEAEVDTQGDDLDSGSGDVGSGDRKPKAKRL